MIEEQTNRRKSRLQRFLLYIAVGFLFAFLYRQLKN